MAKMSMSTTSSFSGVSHLSLASLEEEQEEERLFEEILESKMNGVLSKLTGAIETALQCDKTQTQKAGVIASAPPLFSLKTDYYLTRLCKYANKMFAKVDGNDHSEASGIKVLIYAFVLLDRQASAQLKGKTDEDFNNSCLIDVLERFGAAFTVAIKLMIDCEIEFSYLAKITGLREKKLRMLEAKLLMDVNFDVLMMIKLITNKHI